MFKIKSLQLFNMNNESYTYNFTEGINYFKGKNSSGKTEFYLFIDYMLGSSENIEAKPWYKGTLEKAKMEIEYKSNCFVITRTRNPQENYFDYEGEQLNEKINLKEYKMKLNSVFSHGSNNLENIRYFTNEDLSYRTFTMFNFLGEKGQGRIQDFFEKCGEIKYSVKLNPILNFIFNENLESIYNLQKELDILIEDVKDMEADNANYKFIIEQVNSNLKKLGGGPWYTGNNEDEITSYLASLTVMENKIVKATKRNITDLEVMYSNLSEQIKIYENKRNDMHQFVKDNKNRKMLLSKLEELVIDNDSFSYLTKPIESLLSEINDTIFFSNYLINDRTIEELKKQKEEIKVELLRNNSRFKMYTMEEKASSIAIIKEYLSVSRNSCKNDIELKKKEIKGIQTHIKKLKNSDDATKIKELSSFITRLYYSARNMSSIVSHDVKQQDFKIEYSKKGNILQPIILSKDEEVRDSDQHVNYYTGSIARHTLIQLCGYLGFLNILLKNDEYPIVPILVIDHISKPFDIVNSAGIGKILCEAYKEIGKENLQIFMFDNEDAAKLGINPDHAENLVTEFKTGFNPFFNQG